MIVIREILSKIKKFLILPEDKKNRFKKPELYMYVSQIYENNVYDLFSSDFQIPVLLKNYF